MIKASGYGTNHAFTQLKPIAFEHEDPGPHDIVVDLLFCGVCHSDIH